MKILAWEGALLPLHSDGECFYHAIRDMASNSALGRLNPRLFEFRLIDALAKAPFLEST